MGYRNTSNLLNGDISLDKLEKIVSHLMENQAGELVNHIDQLEDNDVDFSIKKIETRISY